LGMNLARSEVRCHSFVSGLEVYVRAKGLENGA